MALDRTWYNSLIDDDGSGMTGSVWDKADVDALMDAIDAEIARIDQTLGIWTPTIVSAGGGTPVYSWASGSFVKTGKAVIASFRVSITSVGSLAASALLGVGGLPFPAYDPYNGETGGVAIGAWGGFAQPMTWVGGQLIHGRSDFNITIVGSPGAAAISGTVLANITNALYLQGTISYRAI